MSSFDEYKIVPSQKKSELEQFASWFHQDWELFFSDFTQGAGMYVERLPSHRRAILRNEISGFLERNAESSPGDTKKAWYKLGAQAWQAIRQGLSNEIIGFCQSALVRKVAVWSPKRPIYAPVSRQ